MKVILNDIQSGKFAKEWMAEAAGGLTRFKQLREAGQKHPIEGRRGIALDDAVRRRIA
jgi:ketol-acid reductoisomerase